MFTDKLAPANINCLSITSFIRSPQLFCIQVPSQVFVGNWRVTVKLILFTVQTCNWELRGNPYHGQTALWDKYYFIKGKIESVFHYYPCKHILKLPQKNLIVGEVDDNRLPSEKCEPFSKYSFSLKSQVVLSHAALVQTVVQTTLKSLLCFTWFFYYLYFVDTDIKLNLSLISEFNVNILLSNNHWVDRHQ